MFRVRCKSCQHLFSVPDDKAGEPIHCPYCQNPIVIRPAGAAKLVMAPAFAGSPAASPSRTSATIQDDEDEAIILGEKISPKLESVSLPHRAKRVEAIFVNCRACGQRMQISTRDLGKAVQCGSCQAVMKIELPTVEASVGAVVVTDDDDDPPLSPPALEDIPVTHSFARRRAHLRRGVGEKISVVLLLIVLLGGLVWMIRHFQQSRPNPLRPQPAATTQSSSPAKPNIQPAPVTPAVVDSHSWVDAENPGVWDKFIEATWGVHPSAIQNLKPTEPPSELFDAGSMKWFQSANPPKQIGPANIRSILYGFLQQGDELRLCEIQIQCQSAYDGEEFKGYLTQKYGRGADGQSPFATAEWQGRTSADRDVLIEIGGKSPAFDGSQIRAAIQGVR